MKERAVIVFSGGIDSICTTCLLKEYDVYGISFSYGQRASNEIRAARLFAKRLDLKEHKIVDIGFMKSLYGNSNVLTSTKNEIPSSFDYSIVVPIRNAVFLSIATAWAFTINATRVAYGAHTGDRNYPDCRPAFTRKLEQALNEGEKDGIRLDQRTKIDIWSPYMDGLSKGDLLQVGIKEFGDVIFKSWSCYANKRHHCGTCESCNNRRVAFVKAGIQDKTRYMS